MKLLSIAGTAAMFLVGGGILTHGIAPLHHAIEQFSAAAGKAMEGTVAMMADGVIGILAGALVLALVTIGSKLFGKAKTAERRAARDCSGCHWNRFRFTLPPASNSTPSASSKIRCRSSLPLCQWRSRRLI